MVVGLLVVGVVGWFTPSLPQIKQEFGAAGNLLAENYIPYIMYNGGFNTEKGVKIGANGGDINELKSTTCTLSTTQLPLEATSTDVFYCAIDGVASGDQVFVSLPSDNGAEGVSNFSGFMLGYAKASSTAGYIEVGISNFSGVATSTFPLATTSVQVLYIDN